MYEVLAQLMEHMFVPTPDSSKSDMHRAEPNKGRTMTR